MKLFDLLLSTFSSRHKALWNYKRGMDLARKRDRKGALVAYTAAIDSSAIADDLQAMALYNRALVYIASGDDRKGIDDLDRVLAMALDITVVNVQTMARLKLAKIKARAHKNGSQAS